MEDHKRKRDDEISNQQEGQESREVEASTSADPAGPKPKKRKELEFEQLYLDQLPSAQMYEKSYMHRDVITHTLVTPYTHFIITCSIDGHVKFWKKDVVGIEFVKHFRAHLGRITGVSCSADGQMMCTVAVDRAVKVFDVVNFDMINMLKLNYEPSYCELIHKKGAAKAIVAITEKGTGKVRIYDARGDGVPFHIMEKIHRYPIVAIKYNEPYNTVVTADNKGVIEYWDAETFAFPATASSSSNTTDTDNEHTIQFQYKSETDLFEHAKCKTYAVSIAFSTDGTQFVCMGRDRFVRVFWFETGKLRRKYDETLDHANELQKTGSEEYQLESIDFGRRMAGEKEMELLPLIGTPEDGGPLSTSAVPATNAIFDESGYFVLYPSLLGVKVVNVETNRVVRLLGKVENTERITHIALFQGKIKVSYAVLAKKKQQAAKNRAAGSAAIFGSGAGSVGGASSSSSGEGDVTGGKLNKVDIDPILVCTAFKKNRFYLFSKREPEDLDTDDPTLGRDVFNERPSKEDVAVQSLPKHQLGRNAIIHTSMGDIHLKLFPDECPKTVENFTTLSKNGYYNNVTFHRAIKGFMIQTGDPEGDGTGGTSMWGHDFEDEFHKSLKHDRPFMVSMANSGPNTNGSQFFITTVPTPWLDNKHTVFAKVTKGMDVVQDIEKTKVSKDDKPWQDIKIINVVVD